MRNRIVFLLVALSIWGCAAQQRTSIDASKMVGLSANACIAKYDLERFKSYLNPRSAEPVSTGRGRSFQMTTTYYLPEGNLFLTVLEGVVVKADFDKDARPVEERIRAQQKAWSEFVKSRGVK